MGGIVVVFVAVLYFYAKFVHAQKQATSDP
jgi:hypothetical protein